MWSTNFIEVFGTDDRGSFPIAGLEPFIDDLDRDPHATGQAEQEGKIVGVWEAGSGASTTGGYLGNVDNQIVIDELFT